MQFGWQSTCQAYIKSWIHFPAPQKHDMADRTCNPSTEEGKVENSEVQSHHQLHGEFEAILGYMRHCLNKETDKGHWATNDDI